MELSEILGKKKRVVPTSQGDVYVRLLSGERWHDVSNSKDPAILGQDVVQALSGLKETPGNEERLPTDYFHALTTDDIQSLARAIASINVLGDLPIDKPACEGLGELILVNQQEKRDTAQRLIDQARSSTLLGNAWSPDLKIRELKIPDFSNSPINRAAAASEQAAKQTAEGLSLWKQQIESDKQAASESKKQTEENIVVAKASQKIAQKSMWVTIVVAAITVGQFIWSERGTAEERAKQAETEKMQHEATLQVLREQLSAQQQLLSTQPHTPLPKNKESESRK